MVCQTYARFKVKDTPPNEGHLIGNMKRMTITWFAHLHPLDSSRDVYDDISWSLQWILYVTQNPHF